MRINKIIFGFTVAMVALLTSCSQDNESAIYNIENDGLSFTATTSAAVEVSASDPVFTVKLVRGNTASAATGSVTAVGTIGTAELAGITVSNYSFAPGENTATVSVNVAPLEIGEELTLTLSIAEDVVSIGGIQSTTMKVIKAYEWESLGNGYFVDNFFGMESTPEILKAVGFDRYRVMAPCEAYRTDPGNADDDWIATWSAPYIELWVEDGLVFWNEWFTGQNYDADSSQPIYAYHPSAFASLATPDNWTFSKFLDEKTIQLAPYYYIDGVGGWNYTQYDGIVLIALP